MILNIGTYYLYGSKDSPGIFQFINDEQYRYYWHEYKCWKLSTYSSNRYDSHEWSSSIRSTRTAFNIEI
jgi:hypothetical protein